MADESQFDQARLDSYDLTADEAARLRPLVEIFRGDLEAAFGDRTGQVLVNLLGDTLAHLLLDKDDAFHITTTVNLWLEGVAEAKGGLPLQLDFDAELANRVRKR
jgi:hypothetical protein